MMSDLDIQFFLQMGYFPGYQTKFSLQKIVGGVEQGDQEFLVREGQRRFREVISNSLESGRRNIVPLSGGLDSRFILAGLLEHKEAREIETYTFGTPGTYDFDIGRMIARKVGTKHTAIALDDYDWQEGDFFEAAKRSDYQTFLFHHAPMRVLKQFEDGVIWSGYIGDLVTGGHLQSNPSSDIEEAKMRYLRQRCASHFISAEDFRDLIGGPEIAPSLSFDEQIMFSEVGKITAPHVLTKGFEYRTPFINNGFYDFFMRLPAQFRKGQSLFKAMAMKYYPDLFSLPCKNAYGLTLEAGGARRFLRRGRNKFKNFLRSHLLFIDFPALPMTNYFDVDRMLRKSNFAAIVYPHLQDLKKRDVVSWIDIDGLWQRHLDRKANHGDAIKILFSLEINLKGKA